MSEPPVDSYWGVTLVAGSMSLNSRVTACASQEGIRDPAQWTNENRWEWAAAPGWAAAYEYALAAGNPDPGQDSAVITDGMILSQVQAMNARPSLPGSE